MFAGLILSILVASGAPQPVPSPLEFPVPPEVYRAYPDAPRRELEVTWMGSRLVMARKHDRALEVIRAFRKESPTSLIPSVGEMFVFGIHMLENFDFRFEKEFAQAEIENIRIIEAYYDRSSDTRWNNLFLGASLGLRGMMHARRQQYLKGASYGWEAVGYMKKAKEEIEGLPPLYDAYYGIGMYHYWTSWAQNKSLILALFPDKREQGLQELKICVDQAPITSPVARFAWAYLSGLEGRHHQGIPILMPLLQQFPKNIMLRSLLGRLYITMGQPQLGIPYLSGIMEDEPHYTYTGFHLARTLYREQSEPERVRLLLEAFIQEKNTNRPKLYLSQSRFFLAEIYASRREWEKASENFKQVDKNHLNIEEQKRYRKLKRAFRSLD